MQEKKNTLRPNCDYVGRPWGGVGFKRDLSLYFTDEENKRARELLDEEGRFIDFPGVEKSEELERELDGFRVVPELQYELFIRPRKKGGWRVVWTVRPDGRYWMDSWGFGAEDYECLDLYADLDETGAYVAPFRLYGVGEKLFIKEEEA